MQMKKEVYSQPVSEIYELKLLGSVLQGGSPDGTWGKSIQQGSSWGDSAYNDNDNPYGLE